jgi:hypothetical protein
MIAIYVSRGAWSLTLPDGRKISGRAASSGEALCKATALATRLEPIIRRQREARPTT